MDQIARLYVRLAEEGVTRACARLTEGRGQTMAKYALILSAITVVAIVWYKTMGISIKGLLTIDGQL